MKNIKAILIPIIILLAAVFFIFNFQSADDYYKKTQGDFAVTISIDCSTVLSNMDILDKNLKDDKSVPKNGVILPETTIYINDGDSVLDALKKATKEHNIQLEYTQSPNDSYVEGINYLYEFSCGELSGWMYKVNGIFANKGCNAYILTEGDNIEWVYTCDLGKDVGDEF